MTDAHAAPGDVRTRILEVATRLFARHGYGSTSVREVVEAAGVTKPTLYYYFDSKAALFREAVNLHLDNLTAMLTEIVADRGTVRARLRRFIVGFVRGGLEHKDVVRLLSTAHHPSDKDQPTVDLMSVHLRQMGLLGELFTQGVAAGELRADLDVEQAVLAFIGIVNLHTMACVEGMPLRDGFEDTILDLFYRGVSR
jgi:AcrR family transcriptional regulator